MRWLNKQNPQLLFFRDWNNGGEPGNQVLNMSVPDDVPVKRRNNRKWLIKRVDLYFVCQPVLLTASDEDADRKWDIKVDFATGFPSGLESSRHAHWCTCSYIIFSQKWCHLSTAERSIQWRYFIIAHTEKRSVEMPQYFGGLFNFVLYSANQSTRALKSGGKTGEMSW